MTNNAMPLSLTSDTFNALKTDFDLVLRRLLKTMELKGADHGEISLKMKVDFKHDGQIIKPAFEHKVTSAMQIKDELNGELCGDLIMVWDEATNNFVLQKAEDPQLSMFGDEDNDPELSEESKIIRLPGRAELPLAEAEVDGTDPENPDYIDAEYREIEEEDESILANSDEIEIKRISQAKADEITSSLEPLGVFYFIKGGRYIGMDNRAGIVFTEDFPTLDEGKEWLTRAI